jgi:hypothetical protein
VIDIQSHDMDSRSLERSELFGFSLNVVTRQFSQTTAGRHIVGENAIFTNWQPNERHKRRRTMMDLYA